MKPEDAASLIAALRRGDPVAFARLVDTHTTALLHVAREYVANPVIAEEVVKETWIALVRDL